jgi:hypothetical protein
MKKLKIDKNYSVRYDNAFGILGKNFEKYKYYLLYAENSKEVEEKVNEYVDMKNKPYIIYFVFPKALGKKVNLTKPTDSQIEAKTNELLTFKTSYQTLKTEISNLGKKVENLNQPEDVINSKNELISEISEIKIILSKKETLEENWDDGKNIKTRFRR